MCAVDTCISPAKHHGASCHITRDRCFITKQTLEGRLLGLVVREASMMRMLQVCLMIVWIGGVVMMLCIRLEPDIVQGTLPKCIIVVLMLLLLGGESGGRKWLVSSGCCCSRK